MKIWMKAMTATMVLAMAGQAQASGLNGYGVGTSAATGQYLDVYGGVASSVSAYRMAQDSSGNYTNMADVAPVSFDNCAASNVNSPGICSATHSGTTGPGFDLTASTSNSGLIWNGAAVAATSYADLATGKLGTTGTTSYYQTALTLARFVDTLNFNVAGADASTTTNIIVKFQLDGSLLTPAAHGAPGLGTPYGTVDNIFGFGTANGRVAFEQLAANRRYGQENQILNQSNSQGGWVSHSWDSISPGLTQFTGVYALSGMSQILGISNYLSAYTSTGGSFDYGSTSSLNLILPSNVTFTSASGVFLTGLGGAGAVPEPATWAMMIAGFALVGSAMRRRAKVQATYA